MSEISSATITAYQETDYRVLGRPPFTLRIGEASEPLAKLLRQHETNCAAFITACNPFSRKLDEATNAARQAKLAQELAQRGLGFVTGEGKHPCDDWAEPSFLAMGLSLEEAKELGRRYDQNAVVWCGSDTVPKLVLLR